MTLKRMDNVGIVVESLDAAIAFFSELGLRLEGRATIEGEWAGRVTGLGTQRVEIAMMVTPDGHSRLELSRFLAPPVVADHRNAPVNALGYLRVMFTVDDIDETLARLRKRGAQLVGEVVQYEDAYRLCYIRGPEGLLIGLAEELRSVRPHIGAVASRRADGVRQIVAADGRARRSDDIHISGPARSQLNSSVGLPVPRCISPTARRAPADDKCHLLVSLKSTLTPYSPTARRAPAGHQHSTPA